MSHIFTTLRLLERRFPNPGAMELGDPFRILVAVMLSARTRDEQVLKLLPDFWRAFPSPRMLAGASVEEIEARLDTIGMYRQKAKHAKALAQAIVERFDGRVPSTMEELVTIPGVGRKTASVVLVVAFQQSAIAVDTHVFRVTQRLGWIKAKTVEDAEQKLLSLIPKRHHRAVNRVFVKLGRYICIRSPRCWACPVREQCAYKQKKLIAPPQAQEILNDIESREAVLEILRKNAMPL